MPSSPRNLPLPVSRYQVRVEGEISDLSNLQQTILRGRRGTGQNQGGAIRELTIGHSMDGKMYDAKIAERQQLECSFGGVSAEKQLAGAVEDSGDTRHFLAASGQIRKSNCFNIKEIGGLMFLRHCADARSGSEGSGLRINHISDTEKSQVDRLGRTGLSEKMENRR